MVSGCGEKRWGQLHLRGAMLRYICSIRAVLNISYLTVLVLGFFFESKVKAVSMIHKEKKYIMVIISTDWRILVKPPMTS